MAFPTAIDPAGEAGQLADLFNSLSQALDDFRLADHAPAIPDEQLARMKIQGQELEDRAHLFTAQAIAATLLSIQRNLSNIKAVTSDAKKQLAKLTDVSKVISVATSVLSLGTAIASRGPQFYFFGGDGVGAANRGLSHIWGATSERRSSRTSVFFTK